MSKLFLYDPASVTRDTLAIMLRKGYQNVALTNDTDVFWKAINGLADGSIFVLLSHGDKNGPLAVAGNVGDDIDLEVFSDLINKKQLTLYLLSCHTGENPCGATLEQNKVDFVAPKGYADFKTTGNETITVESKEGDKYPGWAGPLAPNRASKSLSLP